MTELAISMAFKADQVAADLLSAACKQEGGSEASLDIGDWPEGMVAQTVDAVLAGLAGHKLCLRGIRTDTAGFAKLGIKYDIPNNAGRYRDVPVVLSNVPFDTIQFVLEPQRT